jgi:hypothetical protein
LTEGLSNLDLHLVVAIVAKAVRNFTYAPESPGRTTADRMFITDAKSSVRRTTNRCFSVAVLRAKERQAIGRGSGLEGERKNDPTH